MRPLLRRAARRVMTTSTRRLAAAASLSTLQARAAPAAELLLQTPLAARAFSSGAPVPPPVDAEDENRFLELADTTLHDILSWLDGIEEMLEESDISLAVSACVLCFFFSEYQAAGGEWVAHIACSKECSRSTSATTARGSSTGRSRTASSGGRPRSGALSLARACGGRSVLTRYVVHRSGPRRYEYDAASGAWLNTRDGSELMELLRTEILEATGIEIYE